MSKEKVLLIGGGGHCHSVIDVLEQENKYKIMGIIDKPELKGKKILGYEVIGSDDDLQTIFQNCKNAVITIGHIQSNKIRVQLFQKLKEIGFSLPIVISPIAYVSKYAQIGEGSIVMHHALVNANAKIGVNCIINSKALVEHDVIIEDNCHIATASVVNGGVTVKVNTFYGSNAVSKQDVEIQGFVKAGSILK
ncbi:NeuD/PglB/VioB family sugar acetyltransferase [Sulfurimonas sp. C5]|uniref:NeuD/PglB/VioB family sugar acetyltransferase n=1 Tax=Sulfurimonas sp. C5 TaxID=3036947 RepID=UPI00245450E5|nr:NeuD/PglB/VioB family sugar acetyltransferase [Sulfurimonas sp. C5]MDH4944078.1 NeuD/PglB/VioB family sugar acetyltransferase [Sulfurimonas sp. C5]